MSGTKLTVWEFLEAMYDLMRASPEAYEQVKAEGWEMVAANHKKKTPEQLAAWMRRSS